MLLEIAHLPRATFYYHRKQDKMPDKYQAAKDEIVAIYHENRGRYGYRRIKQELIAYLDYYNNRRIKARLKGLPPALHRQQALLAA